MPREFRILSGQAEQEEHSAPALTPEKRLRHHRNVTGSILQDAEDAWGDIWDQLQGSVTHGFLVTPQANKGFVPECGWPEFLEKMWALKHYLDCAKRFCEGKE